MLVQIYETSSPEEAEALAPLGVDHVGVLVGDGSLQREQSIEAAQGILSAVPPPSKGSALCLSADLNLIEQIVLAVNPSILHLGASTSLLRPEHVQRLKRK